MAEAIQWYGANKVLQSPKDFGSVIDISVFNNGKCSVSCWKLTPEELADVVQNGGHIFVTVLGGPSQYPMFVGSEENVRSVVADFGKVWNKNKSLDDKVPK